MSEMEAAKRRREVESRVIDKVGKVIMEIERAKHVEHVICSLHSLAVLLFPIDSSILSGSIDESYKEEIVNAKVHAANERDDWWRAFYQGAAFPTLARVLLLDVASNWLTCFPLSAKKHIYDVFFVNGLSTEVVQVLVPCLQQSRSGVLDVNAIQSNVERLLVLCLVDNGGVLKMATDFAVFPKSEDITNDRLKSHVSRVAQIVTSIPDKVRLRSPPLLSSHLFFKEITVQLLNGVVERLVIYKSEMDVNLSFLGEIFSRIARRGSSDVLLSEVTPQILRHVQSCISSNTDVVDTDVFESNPESQFWFNIMEAITDPYTVERIAEQLLRQLATEHASDIEAYWVLWILFHRLLNCQSSVRSMFVDKFLLWKVYPLCCLQWILQFSVLEYSPINNSRTKGHKTTNGILDTVQRLAVVWSKRDFVQSASLEQQSYITAGLGLCLEKMSKEELDNTKDVMHSILQGVSCRLESPANLVRKMASTIALVFSKVVDPKNPLYLDDSCNGESIDWEFGLNITEKGSLSISNAEKQIDGTGTSTSLMLSKDCARTADNGKGSDVKSKSKKPSEFILVDPDEIIDPATLNYESVSDENDDDDDASENSESSESSLQPYDLADDDTDLKRKISQLVDVVGALRKSDDADGVERALDVAESLIRASPDELKHLAGDLVRTLVQVRCSDVTVEGEEDSAEEKRQRALIALVVTCPFESLDTLNKLLYAPNVDVSQRIMILNVMTLAAEELANSKTMKPKHQIGPLISTIPEPQPWFFPSNVGPPGAGSWKAVSDTGTLLNWSNRYERELPLKPGQVNKGKNRRWSLRSGKLHESQIEWSQNKFPLYAAAFMLPAMQGFDKKRHGVDLFGQDFIVLGKLIYMLGACMKCASMHSEASVLAPLLLDMLRSREICHHKEAYVRRAVLFAASCVLVALHPSSIASSLAEGNIEISEGLEWIRTWALHVADSDIDRECYTMALTCLQLHSEMALLASRALESAETTFKAKSISLSSNLSKGTIIIPNSNVHYL